MKKRIIEVILVLCFLLLIIFYSNRSNTTTKHVEVYHDNVCSSAQITYVVNEIQPKKLNVYEEIGYQYRTSMQKLESISDDELYDWYVDYKHMENVYKYVYEDTPETIYDCFTDEELDVLFRIVQAEIGDEWSFIQKCNVASVIFNRLSFSGTEKFGDTLLEVLTTNNQFETYSSGRYKNVEPSLETIYACEFSFSIKDTLNGALFFDSDGSHTKNKNLKYIDNDGAHNFYILKEKNIEEY